MEYIKSKIRDINDFPQKGIVFKDLTTVFKDAKALHQIGEELAALYRDKSCGHRVARLHRRSHRRLRT